MPNWWKTGYSSYPRFFSSTGTRRSAKRGCGQVTHPPGVSILPVMAIKTPKALSVWRPLAYWFRWPTPSTIQDLSVFAKIRAKRLTSEAGTPVTSSAFSGVYALTCSTSLSKPVVHLSTNSLSHSSSAMMTFIMASAKKASVPGRIGW